MRTIPGTAEPEIVDTDSDFGMPAPRRRHLHLANHIPERCNVSVGTQTEPVDPPPKKACKPGKDIRDKEKLRKQIELIEALVGETGTEIENRIGCTVPYMIMHGMLREVKDKSGKLYYAVFYVGSQKQKDIISKVCNEKPVFEKIRHGGPWSTEPGLLEKKDVEYTQGTCAFLRDDWQYAVEALTLVWTLHSADYEGIGRAGLQLEDDAPDRPPMTEAFAAITQKCWHQGIVSKFFREHLVAFYNSYTNSAPMRILCMEDNEMSKGIAMGQELPGRPFAKVGQFDHPVWGQKYEIWENGPELTPPRGCL